MNDNDGSGEHPDRFDPAHPPRNHKVAALMDVSGEGIAVGTVAGPDEDALFLWVRGLPEPVYMSVAEAGMLVSSLICCTHQLTEDRR